MFSSFVNFLDYVKHFYHLNYSFCQNAKFLIKIDDDVTIDWPLLLNFLELKYPDEMSPDLNVILCPSVMRNMRPWRPKVANREDGIQTVMSKW